MSFFYWNVSRWRSCLQNVSYVFPENDGFQLWQPISHMFMHGGYMHLFQYVCFVFFRIGLGGFGEKVLFFYISCGLGAALMHTELIYYFNDAINTLAANGFLRRSSSTFKSRKNKHTMAGAITNIKISLVPMGTVVGASGAIYGVIVAFAFMFLMLN
jgi:membrane associated rhomboid family serine protease